MGCDVVTGLDLNFAAKATRESNSFYLASLASERFITLLDTASILKHEFKWGEHQAYDAYTSNIESEGRSSCPPRRFVSGPATTENMPMKHIGTSYFRCDIAASALNPAQESGRVARETPRPAEVRCGPRSDAGVSYRLFRPE